MREKLQKLRNRLLEIHDLEHAADVLRWDQMTYMPPKGAPYRGRQISTLDRLAHEKLTDAAIGRLLDDLQPYAESLPYDSDEASLIRVTRRLYEKQIRVPNQFQAQLSAHLAETTEVWRTARYANDFQSVRPYLEKTLELSREYANFFEYEHIMDPLIDSFDDGVTAKMLMELYTELKEKQGKIYRAIIAQEPVDDQCLKQHFPKEKQLKLGLEVAQLFGYDLARGRLDTVPHPFATKLSLGDVRITTRVHQKGLGGGLFSSMHEAGHALYELGIDPNYDGTPLDRGASAGVHESQSRLWENIVGRSRGFWEFYYPRLREIFPGQLSDVSLDIFYKAVNKVRPSLIRTGADEVSYNLHIMLRFELEKRMLEGELAIKDLPQAWRELYDEYIGIHVADDTNGCMQDVHWHMAMIGGCFQGYLLGNILGAQYYETALKAHPEIPDEIRNGKFTTLHNWLQRNIYQHGRKFTATELTEHITGGEMKIEPYLRYLKSKYSQIYDLSGL